MNNYSKRIKEIQNTNPNNYKKKSNSVLSK